MWLAPFAFQSELPRLYAQRQCHEFARTDLNVRHESELVPQSWTELVSQSWTELNALRTIDAWTRDEARDLSASSMPIAALTSVRIVANSV